MSIDAQLQARSESKSECAASAAIWAFMKCPCSGQIEKPGYGGCQPLALSE